MAGEPLGEEQVAGRAVNGVDRRVPEAMERVVLVEASPALPDRKDLLGPPLGEPAAMLRDEQGRRRLHRFAAAGLPQQEPPQLGLEPTRQEDVAPSAALGDAKPDP